MSKEAIKLALEALNSFSPRHLTPLISNARTALREALAEQPAQQEPLLKPLTDEQALDALDAAGISMHERLTYAYELQIFRAAEAAHNIKKRNT